MKAIFLDRDNTIIKDKVYMHKVEDIEYFPETFEALALMQQKGYVLFLVTNQSGIGRGYFSTEEMDAVHQQIQHDLIEQGLDPFRDIIHCPHSPEDNCECRKPKPKMLLELIAKWQINPEMSYMVGDKPIDVEAGLAAGVTGVHIGEEANQNGPSYRNLLLFARTL